MLKHLSPKTRLSIAGAALLLVAIFGILLFTSRKDGNSPYVPNYPHLPPQPTVPMVKPTEVAKGPFECGEAPSDDGPIEGKVTIHSDYLCASFSYPSGWRSGMGGALPPSGLLDPWTVLAPNEEGMDFPVALLYPMRTSEGVIPLFGMTLTEVRTSLRNIGPQERPVYALDPVEDPESQGLRMYQLFLVDVPSEGRLYLIKAIYFRTGIIGFDASVVIKEMVHSLKSY